MMNNTEQLKKIINNIGWPSSNLVGENEEFSAWLIAQHSDFDLKFQEKCLGLLRKLPKTTERKKHIAYLIDRVLVNKKRKQVYGTQFYIGKNKKLESNPIRNIKNLDSKRVSVGLESFEVYRKRLISSKNETEKDI